MEENSDLNSICYSKNYLTEVIARIDLVSPLHNLKKELPKKISKAALKHFPIDEPKSAFEQEVLLSRDEIATRKQEFTEWNFYGRNREKRLVITPQAFFVSYTKYEKYENLREEFLEFVTTFFGSLDEAQPSRLGLRYINQLNFQNHNPLQWDEYLNNGILGLLAYKVEGADPTRIFHFYEVSFAKFNLRFQFGIHNPDYPARIKRKAFVLDYDAYYQGLIEPRDIADLLDTYHGAVQKMFENSITDGLRERMNAAK